MNRLRTCLAVSVATGVAGVTGLLPTLPAHAAAAFCGSGPATSLIDLNGDGFDDAAVGDPYATVAGQAEAGAVTVLFGDSDRHIGQGARRVFTQADLGQIPEAGDHFGWDVHLGRADTGENCANLLIGSPGEDLNGRADAGMAHLLSYVTDEAGNPPVVSAVPLTQDEGGGDIEAGDQFGAVVKIVGTPEDEPRRLVIAAPGEKIGTVADAGAVSVFTNLNGGLLVYQGKLLPGGVRVPGTPQAGDRFGASVASGFLNLAGTKGSGFGRGLVVGAPGDVVAGRDGAGSVTVMKEGEDWFETATLITQDSSVVPGGAEAGDQFGYSVALSPRQGSAPRTLAVGAPGEDAGTLTNAGSVTLFTNTGGRMAPWTAFSQATAGVPGRNEAGDRFGHSLAFGFNTPMLLVGVPTEDIGSVSDAGAVQPVWVPWRAEPLAFQPPITEDSAGTPGTVAAGNRFGLSVGALYGTEENLLTVSSVYAGVGSVWVLSDLPAEHNARAWVPGRDGIAAAGAGRFGWSVTN